MTNYRDFKSLTADPTAGTVYARLADIHEDAAKPTAAPRAKATRSATARTTTNSSRPTSALKKPPTSKRPSTPWCRT